MSTTPITRQVLFFVLSVLLPSAMLLAAGFALLEKESELAVRRASEFRTFAARQISDSLHSTLETAYASATTTGRASHSRPPLLVFGPPVEPAQLSAVFRQFMRETAQTEIAHGPGAAVRQYETRIGTTNDPVEKAFLRLRLARAEPEADWDMQLLGDPLEVRDDFGLPMSYYAAERLAAREDTSAAFKRLRNDLHGNGWLDRDALTFLADLLPLTSADSVALQERLDELAVATAGRNLAAPMSGAARWQPGPSSGWLVRLPDPGDSLRAAVHVRALGELFPTLVDTIRSGLELSDMDRTLGPHFPTLTASIPSEALPLQGNQNRFFATGLAAVLGLTLFGGYLLLRDVRRETRLSRLRTRFVSSVSHELRTPLTSIRLFAESMAEDGSTDEAERERGLSIIAHESERLTRMLNNVMSTSRIEQGAMRYRPVAGDLARVAEQAADAMRYEFHKEAVGLDVETEPTSAEFDPDAVEQAVLNLLSNALKYAASGRSVMLRCERRNGDGCLSVSDRGPGIDRAEHDAIFERYYRSEGASGSRTTGAGLGLALVKHIAEGHGGRVELDSQPGEGSTFTIVLPAS